MQITLDIPDNLVNKFSMLQNIDQFLEKLVHYLEIESLKPTETLNMQSLDNNHILIMK